MGHSLGKLVDGELFVPLRVSRLPSELLACIDLLRGEFDVASQGESVVEFRSRKVLLRQLVSLKRRRRKSERDQRKIERLDALQMISYVMHLAEIYFERLAVMWILKTFELDNYFGGSNFIKSACKLL